MNLDACLTWIYDGIKILIIWSRIIFRNIDIDIGLDMTMSSQLMVLNKMGL